MSQDLDFLHEPTKTRKSNEHLWADITSQFTWFPFKGESLTACEIITFMPNWLREPDVVFRLASNGVSNSIITDILNHHRELPEKGEVMNNTVCKLTQTAMRGVDEYEYPVVKMEEGKAVTKIELWSIHQHKQHNTKDYWGLWDPNSLAVGQVHYDNDNRIGAPIPESVDFKLLGDGVRVFPSVENGDGLDLSRCVQFACAEENEKEKFMFPDDFGKICDKIGRTTVEKKHLDGPTFDRWNLKHKEAKAAERKARQAAPSSGVSKATPSKIGKSNLADRKAKSQKLADKIKEAFENGRLDLGADGELILFKAEPVDSTAGLRTQSSAHNSPVDEDSHVSLSDSPHVLTAVQTADPHRRAQVAARARRAQAAGPRGQSQVAAPRDQSSAAPRPPRSEAAVWRRQSKIKHRNAVATELGPQIPAGIDHLQGPPPGFYEQAGVRTTSSSYSDYLQGEQAQLYREESPENFSDASYSRRFLLESVSNNYQVNFANSTAPMHGYTLPVNGYQAPAPVPAFVPPHDGTNSPAPTHGFVNSANGYQAPAPVPALVPPQNGTNSPAPSHGSVHRTDGHGARNASSNSFVNPSMMAEANFGDDIDDSIPLGDAAMFDNVHSAYLGQDSSPVQPPHSSPVPVQSDFDAVAEEWNADFENMLNEDLGLDPFQ